MSDFEKDIMRGEFRGDFTRDTFHPEKTYSRMLMQQGRVQIDADWNEQVSIQLHYLRNLGRDIGGEHWGPLNGNGFAISTNPDVPNDFSISPGHYYVDGILCEAAADVSYINQPNYPLPDNEKPESLKNAEYLVYLDVWERHICYVEDDAIREIALNGPDTATRAKIIWQVKTILSPQLAENDGNNLLKSDYAVFLKAISAIIKPGTGRLLAKVKDKPKTETEPCLVSPDSKYRGNENQLYRVEIHLGSNNPITKQATFKWSKENAAVIFPIAERVDANGTITLTLEHIGRDARCSLEKGDWVEIVDDDYILQNRTENLLQVSDIDHDDFKITLKGNPVSQTLGTSIDKHPYLRHWDQKTGDTNGIVVQESPDATPLWIDLEDGIHIRFPQLDKAIYQSGDYWLIPARTITGDIEWPKDDNGEPKPLLPHGVIHHYAPLALISISGGAVDLKQSLRRILNQMWA